MMRFQTIAVLGFTLAGFFLRLQYLITTHPFFDEYTTVLAARQILRQGLPILPSGLFYEHGLLATYLIVPFTALFIDTPQSGWQAAQWGLMLSRWPSLLLGTVTIPLIYTLGRRINYQSPITNHQSPITRYPISLFAAGLFALSPEGMVWGGRARMYSLATLLVLLTVYWAYRGAAYPAPAKYRWLALLTLLATLLTQFGAMMLVPALVVSMVIVGWFSYKAMDSSRVWFLRPMIFVEGPALAAVIGVAILIKRLGRPLGAAALNSSNRGNLITELVNTVTYQTTFYFTWADTIKFLSRQFGVAHHLWLTIATLAGLTVAVIFWLSGKIRNKKLEIRNGKRENFLISNSPFSNFNLFLWLIFGTIILEMVTLLEPFRRNPRYIIMYLPLFYLIAGKAILGLRFIFRPVSKSNARTFIVLVLLLLFTVIGYNDLHIALVTPEPAYEEAFAHIRADWQPGDALLTMNTPAAGLYLNHVDGFAVQTDAEQFLLNVETAPVDRWLGVPWIGTAADFTDALNRNERSWFVTDTIRQPVYFRGDWQAVVNTQMEQVWANDNVLIYRTRANRIPLPTQPDIPVNATLGNSIQLIGYSLRESNPQSKIQNPKSKIENLHVTLFWQSLTPVSKNYTNFLHLRNDDGMILVQRDSQPLDGAYPTSHWQPNELIIDPITLPLPEDVPSGTYTLFTGLYQADTLERLPIANDTSGENAIRLGEVILP